MLTYQDFLQRYPYDPNTPLRVGGQGAVYCSADTLTGRAVAIKRAQVVQDKTGEKYSVYKEFKLGKSLNHPNLATYYDAFRFHDTGMGVFDFGVMEYIEGGTNLDDFLKTFPSEAQIKSVLIGILKGLGFLHQQNVIHRDLKPNNILVDTTTGTPTAKIIDFGVSKELSSSDTVASAIVGTFEYMAPEQINPLPGQKMIHNLDLWCFGVIVYRIFTGEMPFGSIEDGHTREEIQNRVLDARIPSDVNIIPQPYRQIVERCLVRDVQRRIGSTEELLDIISRPTEAAPEILTPLAAAPSALEEQPAPIFSPSSYGRKKKKTLVWAGAVVLAVVIGAFFGFRFWQENRVKGLLERANELYLGSDYAEAYRILDENKDSPWFTPHASFLLGEILYHGYDPIQEDKERAKVLFQKAVDGEIPEGYLHLADMYEEAKDSVKAQEQRALAVSALEKDNSSRTTAMAALADLYTLEKDTVYRGKARNLYLSAANKGFTYAMWQTGQYYLNGWGGSKDPQEAYNWYERSATKGDPAGMTLLGNAYDTGVGVEISPPDALIWYEKAAAKKNPDGLVRLGDYYLLGKAGLVKNESKAIEYYRQAAEKDHPAALYSLGYVYHSGLGVGKDQKEAFDWYKKAADKNYSPALLELANYYENGWGGLKKDNKQAFAYCKRAADEGYSSAQYQLGNYYRSGKGTPKNNAKAFSCYQDAAKQGHLNAQNGLGYLYDQGIGVGENDKEAVRWYKTAAYAGHPTGQYNLAFMYEFGNGIRMNYDSAHHWYMQAFKNGMQEGREAAIRVEIQRR